jgi:hypothetical protein
LHRTLLALPLALALAGCPDSGFSYDGNFGSDDAAVPDLRPSSHTDGGNHPVDMAHSGTPDMVTVPAPSGPGSVTASGGTVTRLLFGVTGDTRPPSVGDSSGYPTSIIQSVFRGMASHNVQFAADTGDHMWCSTTSASCASAQMSSYTSAFSPLHGVPVFMTLGNHECGDALTICAGTTTAKLDAFVQGLSDQNIVPPGGNPYYSFDVNTMYGMARFVSVADNAWDSTQKSWLEQTLTDADARATYTFVLRHHPINCADCQVSTAIQDSLGVIKQHPYSLLMTGHSHEFKVDQMDTCGRTIVIGTGGAAPLDGTWTSFGYVIVDQLPGGNIRYSYYDAMSGNVMGQNVFTPRASHCQ